MIWQRHWLQEVPNSRSGTRTTQCLDFVIGLVFHLAIPIFTEKWRPSSLHWPHLLDSYNRKFTTGQYKRSQVHSHNHTKFKANLIKSRDLSMSMPQTVPNLLPASLGFCMLLHDPSPQALGDELQSAGPAGQIVCSTGINCLNDHRWNSELCTTLCVPTYSVQKLQ